MNKKWKGSTNQAFPEKVHKGTHFQCKGYLTKLEENIHYHRPKKLLHN